jgi:hypothetical protein
LRLEDPLPGWFMWLLTGSFCSSPHRLFHRALEYTDYVGCWLPSEQVENKKEDSQGLL